MYDARVRSLTSCVVIDDAHKQLRKRHAPYLKPLVLRISGVQQSVNRIGPIDPAIGSSIPANQTAGNVSGIEVAQYPVEFHDAV
jgi:hypothetical protein